MKKVTVEITETLKRFITVEAESASEAIAVVADAYSNGRIALDSNDFAGFDIRKAEEWFEG